MIVPAFAKVNLGLYVLGRRPDGYHRLRTIFQTVALHDRIQLSPAPENVIQVTCDDEHVPSGPENLAWKAADLYRKQSGVSSGVRIHIQKHIPVGAGLGGGSSDAAAVLFSLRRLPGFPRLPLETVRKLALSIGSDVPFFLLGGTAAGEGRGEILQPLPDSRDRTLLLVYPGYPLDTAKVFQKYSEGRALKKTVKGWPGGRSGISPGRRRVGRQSAGGPRDIDLYGRKGVVEDSLTTRMEGSNIPDSETAPRRILWQSGDFGNDLESAASSLLPILKDLKEKIWTAGASRVFMSGSGSTMVGLFDDRRSALHGSRMLDRPGRMVHIAATLSRRVYRKSLCRRSCWD